METMNEASQGFVTNYGSIQTKSAPISESGKSVADHKCLHKALFAILCLAVLAYSGYIEIYRRTSLMLTERTGQMSDSCKSQVESIYSPRSVASPGKKLHMDIAVSMQKHSFCLYNQVLSAWFRTFDEKIPGDVIRVKPGQRLDISLKNELSVEDEGLRREPNTFGHPNTTSLHIHGIHASPVSEDNVFKTCNPGSTVSYSYKFRETHLRGTFFLHPHFHGSSTLQVGFAMASAVIVQDTRKERENSILNTVVDDFALVFGYYEQNTGSGRDFLRESKLARSSSSVPTNTDELRFLFVNGKYNPALKLVPGYTYRLRLINAAIDGVINLQLVQAEVCDWVEIAADGVYHEHGRRRALLSGSGDSLLVVPGSRKDVLVRCGDGLYDSEIQVQSLNSASTDFLGLGTNILQGEVFRLSSEKPRRHKEVGFFMLSDLRTGLHQRVEDGDLRELDVSPSNVFVLRYNFPGPRTKAEIRDGDLYQFYGINGRLYNGKSEVQVWLNEVHEWIVVNDFAMDKSPATESHPFHMHTNHFQIVGVSRSNLATNSDFHIGDWRDTVSIPPGSNITIRFRPRDFTGKSLAHCHIFTHSDTGMMIAFDIIKA